MTTTIDGYELENCPFCGSDKDLFVVREDVIDPIWFAIGCRNCRAEGPTDLGLSGAAEKWNERYSEEPPTLFGESILVEDMP